MRRDPRNGSLEIDPVAHEVRVNGQPVALVPLEFQILAELAAHPGRLVTRGRLLRAVWGAAYSGEDHYIHVYVSQIRKKLAAADPDGELSDLSSPNPGVGYQGTPTRLERSLSDSGATAPLPQMGRHRRDMAYPMATNARTGEDPPG